LFNQIMFILWISYVLCIVQCSLSNIYRLDCTGTTLSEDEKHSRQTNHRNGKWKIQ
jgi:hypothetical protein